MGQSSLAIAKRKTLHSEGNTQQKAHVTQIKINTSEECAVVSTLYNYVSLHG